MLCTYIKVDIPDRLDLTGMPVHLNFTGKLERDVGQLCRFLHLLKQSNKILILTFLQTSVKISL